MKTILETDIGPWVELETRADGKLADELTGTPIGAYLSGTRDRGEARFFCLLVRRGEARVMPISMMCEPNLFGRVGGLTTGYRNSNPFPAYAAEYEALQAHLGFGLPPYRYGGGNWLPTDCAHLDLPAAATSGTPRWDAPPMPTVLGLGDGSRWVRVERGALALASSLSCGASDRIAEAGADLAEGTLYGLTETLGEGGFTVTRMAVLCHVPGTGAPLVVGCGRLDPYSDHADRIRALGNSLGLDLPPESYPRVDDDLDVGVSPFGP